MKHEWLGLIELFVVLLFAAGWGVLELVTRRMDRRRAMQTAGRGAVGAARAGVSEEPSRHPER